MPDLPEAIIAQPEELARCCAHLASCARLGLDTEFVGEDTYHPHLCLVQVATADCLYLIDPLTVGPLDAFWQLVIAPERQTIVHAGREEVRICQLATGQAPGDLFDIQLAAGLVGPVYPLGHGALVQQQLGVQLSKGETLTEWRDRPLTRQQVRYAFDDVRFLLPLHDRLSARLEQHGRSDWAREEFRRLARHAAPETGENERWRRLRGIGGLDRKRLAVVRELFQWRDAAAARSNRPPRSLVRDDLLIEIARRNPDQAQDLHVIRGLPRRDLDAIVAVVKQARARPAEEWPAAFERDSGPAQVPLLAGLLGAVLASFCVGAELAQSLVASGNDLKLLVRSFLQTGGPPAPDESLLAQGWRAEHVLPLLCEVLRGRRIHVADLASEAPLRID